MGTESCNEILELPCAVLREIFETAEANQWLHRTAFPLRGLQLTVLITQFDPRFFHFAKLRLLLLIQQQQKFLPCFVQFCVGGSVLLLRAKVHVVLVLLCFAWIFGILAKSKASEEQHQDQGTPEFLHFTDNLRQI